MATGIDKWLRGVEDLTELDPADLEQRVSALRSEVEVIQLKIAVLDQLLAQVRRRTRHRPAVPAPISPTAAKDEPGPNGTQQRASTWKRDAVVSLIREQPNRPWTAQEIRATLNERGVLESDEGTPTRLLLRRLAERGDLVKLGPATYAVSESGGASNLFATDEDDNA